MKYFQRIENVGSKLDVNLTQNKFQPCVLEHGNEPSGIRKKWKNFD
jgi:hypothetical protein